MTPSFFKCFSLKGNSLSDGIIAAEFAAIAASSETINHAALVSVPLTINDEQCSAGRTNLLFLEEVAAKGKPGPDIFVDIDPREWVPYTTEGLSLIDPAGDTGHILLQCKSDSGPLLIRCEGGRYFLLLVENGEPRIVPQTSRGSAHLQSILLARGLPVLKSSSTRAPSRAKR